MNRFFRIALACLLTLGFAAAPLRAQTTQPKPTPPTDDSGPVQQNDGVVLKKKSTIPDDTPPPAPAEEKVKNPDGLGNYSLRVDVPIVTVDVSVQLDKTRQFVPGLKPGNFRIFEDGVAQKVTDVRMRQAPITAVMLLEFAANSYAFIQDMQQASYVFFRSLKPEDYIAVITFDLRTHILTDFTRDKDLTAQALRTLTLPGFSDTDEFDALYETLDRTSRIDGRKYIILISSGPRHLFQDHARHHAEKSPQHPKCDHLHHQHRRPGPRACRQLRPPRP